MIFFGTKSKQYNGQQVGTITCPECHKASFTTYGVLTYFHIYWIPTFLTSKTVGASCDHCKHALSKKEIPSHALAEIKSSIFTAARIIPRFTGLLLIASVVGIGVYQAHKTDQEEAKFIAQPAVNDVYLVDTTKFLDDSDSEYKYGAMRVAEINANKVSLVVSKTTYNKLSGVRKDIRESKAQNSDYYDSRMLTFEIDELKKLKESAAIRGIRRLK